MGAGFLAPSKVAERLLAGSIPFVIEIPWREPAEAFGALSQEDWLVFLDSARPDGDEGRYSFLAVDPYEKVTAHNGVTNCDGEPVEDNFFEFLRAELNRYAIETVPGLPPFQGGAAGYFGYELGTVLERVPRASRDDMAAPDGAVGLYDVVLAFDLQERQAFLISTGAPAPAKDREMRARRRAAEFLEKLDRPAAPAEAMRLAGLDWRSCFTAEAYRAAVKRVIDYIYAGDIFQANLTQRFLADLPEGVDPAELYLTLRNRNPAPFAACLRAGDTSVLSTSPERFLKLTGKAVETRPIKGTRRRADDPAKDAEIQQELLASEKDRAENIMIVDLLRNDLSRVCRPGSVEVREACALKSYETVHHLVSTVTGTLEPDCGAIDLLKAAFPGGSITGAPKIRAMEIIAELEPVTRGPYCGAIGYIGFDGAMDTNIVIRTMVIRGGKAAVQAGGGIVADSDPAAEYQESLDKAAALLDAFGAAKRDVEAAE